MDRIDEMRVFVRVVEERRFSSAAETLGLSRSTVSEAVKRIEARLGTRLFDRTARGLVATLDGEAWYRRCLLIISNVEDAETAFAGGSAGGVLRVNAPGALVRDFLLPKLPEFLARHPDLQIVLSEGGSLADLVREGIDCMIRAEPPAETDLIVRRLGELPVATVASSGYLKRHGKPDAPADLDGHITVGSVGARSETGHELDFTVDGQSLRRTLPGSLSSTSSETRISAARQGMSLIQVPRHQIIDDLASGQLIEVLSDYPAPAVPVTVLYPRDRQLSPRVRVFLDCLLTIAF